MSEFWRGFLAGIMAPFLVLGIITVIYGVSMATRSKPEKKDAE